MSMSLEYPKRSATRIRSTDASIRLDVADLTERSRPPHLVARLETSDPPSETSLWTVSLHKHQTATFLGPHVNC
jgi:hypothetical protein